MRVKMVAELTTGESVHSTYREDCTESDCEYMEDAIRDQMSSGAVSFRQYSGTIIIPTNKIITITLKKD